MRTWRKREKWRCQAGSRAAAVSGSTSSMTPGSGRKLNRWPPIPRMQGVPRWISCTNDPSRQPISASRCFQAAGPMISTRRPCCCGCRASMGRRSGTELVRNQDGRGDEFALRLNLNIGILSWVPTSGNRYCDGFSRILSGGKLGRPGDFQANASQQTDHLEQTGTDGFCPVKLSLAISEKIRPMGNGGSLHRSPQRFTGWFPGPR